MKTKIIPFDLETAKKIQAGEIEGRIRTKEGDFTARIICFDKIKLVHSNGTTVKQIVSLTYNENSREDELYIHNQKGEIQAPFGWQRGHDLVLEVPDNEPQFKPFDKVLVRHSVNGENAIWEPQFYSMTCMDSVRNKLIHKMLDGYEYDQVIPYEGNEHLVGTTDKPKEE